MSWLAASQANYNSSASLYDQSRALWPAKERLWLSLFRRHLGLNTNTRVLDVGCGTGRFSTLMARQLRCSVVGIDPSSSMLAKARAKDTAETEWLIAEAEALPFSQGAFDACLASQVVHHFKDKRQAFLEMYRVLRPGGRLGVRYSSHAQLRTILDYRFFPSALQIDCERIPDIQVVRDLMRVAGFDVAEEHVVSQQLFESVDTYLNRLRDKYASVLWLISEEEYHKGLEAAAAYFKDGTFNTSDQYAQITFLVSIK